VKRSILTDFCLRHPVSTAMVFTALLAVGIASLIRIPLETYPELNYPRLTVSGWWFGASPEAIEAFVSAPIEGEASTLPGIEEVTSTSSRESASITLEFAPETDMDFVRLELNEKIARLREDMPPGVNISVPPYVPPNFRQEFLLAYTFTGPYDVNELKRFAEDLIQRPLDIVEGVAQVNVSGGEDRELQVILDEEKAEALGISQREVSSRLSSVRNMVQTVGTVRQGNYQYNLVAREDFDELTTLSDIIVARRRDRYIRLGEIATVRDAYSAPRSYERLNGVARLAIRINAVAGSNIVEVAERVKARIAEVEPTFPPGTTLIEQTDNSEGIREELGSLRFRSIIIIFLIFSVLLLFLRGIANPLIILSSIATSVLLTVGLFYFLGGSLNMMSLAGLAMGFGLMVDNSIVVLDNIHRHRERGSGRLAAASIGTSEVILPILTGTATTIVVFLPFLYLQGDLQAAYVPFALAVVTSLACSLLVSFTLIPSIAARALRKLPVRSAAAAGAGAAEGGAAPPRDEDPWALGDLERESARAHSGEDFAEHTLGIGDNIFQKVLRWMLTWKYAVIFVVLTGVVGSYHLFDRYVTKGRIWRFGGAQTELLRIGISAPTGSDLDVMETLVKQFESKLLPMHRAGQVKDITAYVGSESANITVEFPEEIIRQGLPYLVKDQMSVFSSMMGGVRIFISGFGDGFSTGGFSTSSLSQRITLLGYNYLQVKGLAEDLAERLLRNPRIREVNTNYSSWYGGGREKQIVLRFDRRRLAEYGLTSREMVSFVQRYIQGRSGGQIVFQGEEVAFETKVEGFTDRDIVDLMNVQYTAYDSRKLRLSDVATMTVEPVMGRIERKDQQYSRTVAYEFRGPYRMGQRVRDEIIESMILPNGYEFDESERIWQTEEEKKQIMLILGFAILLVYMLTSALYESFFHPFTIILTVPLALVGVFLGYFLFDKGFDRTAYVGVILMGGIVVNNSIILVDHINNLRKILPKREAVIRAARERARPILMTTFTTVIGLLPLIIGATEGQDQWYTLAFTICVSLPVATFFTLTIIPLIYEIVDSVQRWARLAIGSLVLVAQGEAGQSDSQVSSQP
jgi:HAE1 family hydrophobic/amphiphilic exporter-1